MKKSLLSLLTIAGVAVVAFGATQAFFSDQETSTGNVLQAGALDLTVDSTAHYLDMVCNAQNVWELEGDTLLADAIRPELVGAACDGSWTSTDLTQEMFFNLSDIKPGDYGENTLSLTVTDNDAWACVVINNLQNDDNDLTEPEEEALDSTGGEDQGELAENLNFTAWLDQGTVAGWQCSDEAETAGCAQDTGEGDNLWQGDPAEPLLFTNESGPASDVLNGQVYALADSTTGGQPLTGGVTNYLGLQWCAGAMNVDNTAETITCDGSDLGNIIQTDTLTADVSVYIEQHRNNPTFTCEGANLLELD